MQRSSGISRKMLAIIILTSLIAPCVSATTNSLTASITTDKHEYRIDKDEPIIFTASVTNHTDEEIRDVRIIVYQIKQGESKIIWYDKVRDIPALGSLPVPINTVPINTLQTGGMQPGGYNFSITVDYQVDEVLLDNTANTYVILKKQNVQVPDSNTVTVAFAAISALFILTRGRKGIG